MATPFDLQNNVFQVINIGMDGTVSITPSLDISNIFWPVYKTFTVACQLKVMSSCLRVEGERIIFSSVM